jgi:hypothetical protein
MSPGNTAPTELKQITYSSTWKQRRKQFSSALQLNFWAIKHNCHGFQAHNQTFSPIPSSPPAGMNDLYIGN